MSGVAFGLLVAAAIRPPAPEKMPKMTRTPTTLMVLTTGNGTVRASIQADEISRLETRNRRLEALVEVLRSRIHR